ncbi:hypothetical protein RB195_019058 [Necator americanus]|uniref:Uncharacterized protein n=1 Tax=Necator americanus TaxID=51031 RepID=A0ABR1CEF8_NECAM
MDECFRILNERSQYIKLTREQPKDGERRSRITFELEKHSPSRWTDLGKVAGMETWNSAVRRQQRKMFTHIINLINGIKLLFRAAKTSSGETARLILDFPGHHGHDFFAVSRRKSEQK